VSEAKLKTDIELIRSLNKDAHIITTPWDDIDGKQILDAMENVTNLELEMLAEAAAKVAEEHEHEHHHHHQRAYRPPPRGRAASALLDRQHHHYKSEPK
jgi:G3E family GTPase